MDKFRELSAFVAVAKHGAFSAAAREMALSPASLTRLIGGLEERLGVRLFNRTTRRVSLTEDGRSFLADAEGVLQRLADAEAAAAGAGEAPTGLLRITAPTIYGMQRLSPIVMEFLDAHPQVCAELLLLDRTVDLIEEGVDVALRIGELPDSSLIARRVGVVRRVVVASPAYIERAGAPRTLDELSSHRLVHFTGAAASTDWEFSAGGRRRLVRIAPDLTTSALPAAIEAARAGWGITRCLSYQTDADVAEGRLVEVLTAFEDRDVPIHLLHAESRQASPRTRLFIDLAVKRLRSKSPD